MTAGSDLPTDYASSILVARSNTKAQVSDGFAGGPSPFTRPDDLACRRMSGARSRWRGPAFPSLVAQSVGLLRLARLPVTDLAGFPGFMLLVIRFLVTGDHQRLQMLADELARWPCKASSELRKEQRPGSLPADFGGLKTSKPPTCWYAHRP
jgi:hypothetical protein